MEDLAIIFPREYPRDFHWICNDKIRNNFQPDSHHTLNKQSDRNSGMRCSDKNNHNQYGHIFAIEIIILYCLYNELVKAYFRNAMPRFLRD